MFDEINSILESASNSSFITEATVKKSQSTRRYKCPYCEQRYTRVELVDHINDEHEDMIPKDYTAARIVFNSINKKDHGTCIICGKETMWNENTWRYNRDCGSPACKKAQSDRANANMMKVHGKTHLLNDPEHQNKMLKGRSISGEYRFEDGGTHDYVGTYERKCLEFLDKVMHFNSSEIETPGPVVEYMYKGEKHFWITDLYIPSYNLAIDVKDGGSNPNNRDMQDYRAKQNAKESAIIKQGKYNYLRLTDNNFAQLLSILAELKEQLLDLAPTETIHRIHENSAIKNLIKDATKDYSPIKNKNYKTLNEYCSAVIGVMRENKKPNFIVPYLVKNTFELNYGVTDDPTLEHVLISNESGDVSVIGRLYLLNECENFMVFETTIPLFRNTIKFKPRNLLEVATAKRFISPDQLLIDESFKQIRSFKDEMKDIEICLESTLRGNSGLTLGVLSESNVLDNIMYYQDDKGFFAENMISKFRTPSYQSIEDIPKSMVDLISENEKGDLYSEEDLKKVNIFGPTIISGFAGIGKTTFIKNFPGKAIDLESGEFKWLDYDHSNTESRKGQNKIVNPDFPNNYIKAIKDALLEYDIVFVAQQPDLRKAMDDECMEYILAYPCKHCKSEYIKRYANRNNSETFVNLLRDNFDSWVDGLDAVECRQKIKLDKGKFISDYINF